MKTFLFVIGFLFLAFATTASGQTLGPPIAEFQVKSPGKIVKGSVMFRNDAKVPMYFSIDLNSVVFENRQVRYLPLASDATVKLSQTGGKLQPLEVHRVDYQISCQRPNCQIALAIGFFPGHVALGQIAVKTVLPHLVYIGETKRPRYDALNAAGLWQQK